ncbi:MAG: hypothetical protein K2M68_10035 [Muribaculaceae bacterium]|nr:hypothetical protein [Muribaculaceae bacterium]
MRSSESDRSCLNAGASRPLLIDESILFFLLEISSFFIKLLEFSLLTNPAAKILPNKVK